MAHSDAVARQHYLWVNQENLDAATRTRISVVRARLWAQPADSGRDTGHEAELQISKPEEAEGKAGERIRTADVQLGNSEVGAQALVPQELTTRFAAENEDYKWVASH